MSPEPQSAFSANLGKLDASNPNLTKPLSEQLAALHAAVKKRGPFADDPPSSQRPVGYSLLDGSAQSENFMPHEINTVVQTFWSRPLEGPDGKLSVLDKRNKLFWHTREAALAAWYLSVSQLRKHYPGNVVLYTDSSGAELATRLSLPYTRIVTPLNNFAQFNHRVWSAAKLVTYAQQTGNFLHVDWDAILTQPIQPPALHFCQHLDWLYKGDKVADMYKKALSEFVQRWPTVTNLVTDLLLTELRYAASMGFIYAGPDLAYCSKKILSWWAAQDQSKADTAGNTLHLILEQHLLTAMVHGPFAPMLTDRDAEGEAAKHGLIHFIGLAKQNPLWCAQLTELVRRRHSNIYHRFSST